MSPTGLKSINEEFKKNAPVLGPTVKQLKVFTNEHAFGRFLATGDEKDNHLQSYYAHEMNAEGKFWDEYCTTQDGILCEKCLRTKPKARFGVWMWVDTVLRKFQNPAYTEGREGALPWKKTVFGQDEAGEPDAFYLQEVNDVRMFIKGPGRQGYILNQLISSYNDYSTLMDRTYIISRKGEKLETHYSITPYGEKSPLSEKQSSVYNQLPGVIEVLSGKAQWPPKKEAAVKIEDGEKLEEFNPLAAPKMLVADEITFEPADEEEIELETATPAPEIDQDEMQASLDAALASIAGDDEPIVKKSNK